MYSLVHRIPHGLDNLKELLEEHIHSQGLRALDKCSDLAISVCISINVSTHYACRNYSVTFSLFVRGIKTTIERLLHFGIGAQ